MQLYWSPRSRSFSALWLMEETGQPYERVQTDLSKGEQKTPDYLKINPRGRVPALVVDDGTIVENTAILDYVAGKYAPQLMPKDPAQRARAISLMAWFSNSTH